MSCRRSSVSVSSHSSWWKSDKGVRRLSLVTSLKKKREAPLGAWIGREPAGATLGFDVAGRPHVVPILMPMRSRDRPSRHGQAVLAGSLRDLPGEGASYLPSGDVCGRLNPVVPRTPRISIVAQPNLTESWMEFHMRFLATCRNSFQKDFEPFGGNMWQ